MLCYVQVTLCYAIRIGQYDGIIDDHYLFAGDSMDVQRNQKFTTLDVDNDKQ
jgi:hypothetical protein